MHCPHAPLPPLPQAPEDALSGALLATLQVTDEDSSFPYHNFFIVNGNHQQKFAVSSAGALTVLKQFDREEQDSYELQIAVTDGAFTSYTKLQVVITDVNGKYNIV